MQRLAVRLPEWDEPLVRLAESLRAAGEFTAAEETYRQVLEINPRRTEALIALSGLLLLRGEADQARDLLVGAGIRPGQRRGMEHSGAGPANGR